MSVVMGVMVVLMIVGFLGFGHHHGMMGGHDKEDHKEESVIHDHNKEAPCPDCPVESNPKRENGNDPQDGQSNELIREE